MIPAHPVDSFVICNETSSGHRFRERLIGASHHIEICRHEFAISMNGGRGPSDENSGMSCRRLIDGKRSAEPD